MYNFAQKVGGVRGLSAPPPLFQRLCKNSALYYKLFLKGVKYLYY